MVEQRDTNPVVKREPVEASESARLEWKKGDLVFVSYPFATTVHSLRVFNETRLTPVEPSLTQLAEFEQAALEDFPSHSGTKALTNYLNGLIENAKSDIDRANRIRMAARSLSEFPAE